MSKKILTQELIEERLAEKGYPLTHDEGMTYEFMLKKACEYHDAEISDDWDDNADFFIYSETTADGYEVYIATNDSSSPSINDVYYTHLTLPKIYSGQNSVVAGTLKKKKTKQNVERKEVKHTEKTQIYN